MYKKVFLLAALLMFAAPVMAAPVGVFDFQADIGRDVDWGNPLGIGTTVSINDDEYLITAGGNDIWNQHDGFHYAYKEVSGSVRIEASLRWQDAGWNDWTKGGVMLRESLASGSIFYTTLIRKGTEEGGLDPWEAYGKSGDMANFQFRQNTDDWAGNDPERWQTPQKVAIQRIDMGFGGYDIIQSLADFGSGWEVIGTRAGYKVSDSLLVGIGLTSGDNAHMHQFIASDVVYTPNPDLVNYTFLTIPGGSRVDSCGSTQRGFNIKTAKCPPGWDLITMPYETGEYLAENGELGGDPSLEKGERQEVVVNLHDSGGRFLYENDQSFPGIDPFEQPTVEWDNGSGNGTGAGGDDDSHFATLVTGCIELTAGVHVIGGHSDDGVLIRIGGVEIGRTASWNSIDDFMFNVEVAGLYPFRAVMYEQGGGADLELYEVFSNGTRILLNDLNGGGSAVYVPEPATIALLGFGGLAMLRVRRKR